MSSWITLDDYVTCPFEPMHVMRYSKFHNHFVKCKKNHPNDLRKQCPYNATELIQPGDMEKHLEECVHKFKFGFRSFNNKENGYFVDQVPPPRDFGEDDRTVPKHKDVEPTEPEHKNVDNFDSVSAVFTPAPKVPKGRGRGAIFRELLAKEQEKMHRTSNEVEVTETPICSTGKFSFICEKNITPTSRYEDPEFESEQSTETVEPECIGISSTNTNSIEECKKMLGRGRGTIFSINY